MSDFYNDIKERYGRIKELYRLILKEDSQEKLFEYANELILLQRSDGSWAVIDNWVKNESEVRVDYGYFPTYYATAALICVHIKTLYPWESKIGEALLSGLEIAKGRKLQGHGFSGYESMLEALAIYREAGLYKWLLCDECPIIDFNILVCAIIDDMRERLESGKTVLDWNYDFRDAFEKEVREFGNSDSCMPHIPLQFIHY